MPISTIKVLKSFAAHARKRFTPNEPPCVVLWIRLLGPGAKDACKGLGHNDVQCISLWAAALSRVWKGVVHGCADTTLHCSNGKYLEVLPGCARILRCLRSQVSCAWLKSNTATVPRKPPRKGGMHAGAHPPTEDLLVQTRPQRSRETMVFFNTDISSLIK